MGSARGTYRSDGVFSAWPSSWQRGFFGGLPLVLDGVFGMLSGLATFSV